MSFLEKRLAQSIASITPAQVYIVPAATRTIIKAISVCNTTAVDKTFSIFMDNAGATYDETTAIFFNTVLRAKETKLIDSFFILDTAGATIGAQASDTDVTFTFNGGEVS